MWRRTNQFNRYSQNSKTGTKNMKAALFFLASSLAFSQTIITINPTDQISNGPATLNFNFSALNSGKLHYGGTWSSGTAYNQSDLVFYSGASYISLQSANFGNNPASSPTYWVALPQSGGLPTASANQVLAGPASGSPATAAARALVAADLPSSITSNTSGNAATATSTAQVNGATIPASQPCVGTNSSSQVIAGTCGGSLPSGATGNIPALQGAGTSATYPVKLNEDIINNQLILGNASDAKNATYVYIGYSVTGASANNIFALIVYYSNDGATFNYYPIPLNSTNISGWNGATLADPTWTVINGRLFVFYTQNTSAALGQIHSDDWINFVQDTNITVTGTFGSCSNGCMGQYTWAPEIFQLPSEIPAFGAPAASYHIYYGSGAGTYALNLYHIKAVYTYSTQTWAFTNEAGTSNAADLLLNGQTVSTIDPSSPIIIGSTVNVVFARGNPGSAGCAGTSCGLQLMTCTSVAAGCSLASSGNWTGQLSGTTYDSEAPSLVVHGIDGSGNPILRMYYMVVPNSSGMRYIQASLTGGNLNTLTWSSPVTVNVVGMSQTASSYPYGGPNHGTVKADQSVETFRNITNAVEQQGSSTVTSTLSPFCVGCATGTSGDMLHVNGNLSSASSGLSSGPFSSQYTQQFSSSGSQVLNLYSSGSLPTINFITGTGATGQKTSRLVNNGSNFQFQFVNDTYSATTTPIQFNQADTSTTFGGAVKLQVLTVSTLPTCNSGEKGAVIAVSDAASPTYNATLTGGGTGATANVLAFCNGTNWTAH
jgi:hypothetical protein